MTRRQALNIFNFDANTQITPELINKTYKKIAKQIHPDKHNNDAKMVKMFSQLNMANKILLGEEIPDLETKDIPLVSPKEIELKIINMWNEYNLFKYEKFKDMKLNKIQKILMEHISSEDIFFVNFKPIGNKISYFFKENILIPILRELHNGLNLLNGDIMKNVITEIVDSYYYDFNHAIKKDNSVFWFLSKWIDNDEVVMTNETIFLILIIAYYTPFYNHLKSKEKSFIFNMKKINKNYEIDVADYNSSEYGKNIIMKTYKKIISLFFKLAEKHKYIRKINSEDNTFDQAIKIYKIWQEVKRLKKFKTELLSDLKTI